MDRLSFYVNKKIVYVFIEYKNNKNMYLKIKKGQIYCLVPKHTKESIIKNFINQHIEKFVKFLKTKKENDLYSLTYDFLVINGKKFFFKRLSGFLKPSIEIYNNGLYIKTANSSDFSIRSIIKKYFTRELFSYLKIRLPYWESKMKLPVHSVEIVNNKITWGQNLINKNKVFFSLRLFHFPKSVIDYVIVHELTHTIVPNHSVKFWNTLKKYLPNYLIQKRKLKNDSDLNEI